MKRLIIAVCLMGVYVLALKGILLATTSQARSLGVVNVAIQSSTTAAISQTTATARGQLIFCTDCNANAGTICIASSTLTAQNGFILSTGTQCR